MGLIMKLFILSLAFCVAKSQSNVTLHGSFTHSFLGLGTKLDPSIELFLPPSDTSIIVSGFDRIVPSSLATFNLAPLTLNSKLGLGLSTDTSGLGLIDSTGFIQLDISQFSNIQNIVITLRGLVGSDQFVVYGSTLQGYLGDVIISAGLLGVVDEISGAVGGTVVGHINLPTLSNTMQTVGLTASNLNGSPGSIITATSNMIGNTISTAGGFVGYFPILGGIISNPFTSVVTGLTNFAKRSLRNLMYWNTPLSNTQNTLKDMTTTSSSDIISSSSSNSKERRSLQLPLNSYVDIIQNGVETITGTLGNGLLSTDNGLISQTGINISMTNSLSNIPIHTDRVIGNVGGLVNSIVPNIGDILQRTITIGSSVNNYDFIGIKAGIGLISIASVTITV